MGRPTEGERSAARVSSVLFVCGLNSIRSPMAEALARHILPASTYVMSAGVRGGERDPFVDAVLSEVGLSLGTRRPRRFDELEDSYFDLIVTLAPEAHHAALDATGAEAVDVEFWQMPDPSTVMGSREQILDAYRDLRHRIEERIRSRLLKPEGPEEPQAGGLTPAPQDGADKIEAKAEKPDQ